MSDINKIGLLLLNPDGKKFLVCEKDKSDMTSDFIMPGGQLEKGESDEECLIREIGEELSVQLVETSLVYIKEYIDVAAGDETKQVSIKLYQGVVIGEAKPSQEIVRLHWIGKEDLSNLRISPIIRNKILPDLIASKILG
jgi:8-oxo-dGTP pyrophosphatase MutT (NUDIX family)